MRDGKEFDAVGDMVRGVTDMGMEACVTLGMLQPHQAQRLAEAFRARVIDATTESFIFELTGAPKKIDDFVELMRPIGLVEVSRTGVAAITRGPVGM